MMDSKVMEALNTALEYWGHMQTTSGDEGAEWATIFERHFYLFIEQFETWYSSLDRKPKVIEEAEQLKEVQEIQGKLPGPLQLNFIIELERIVDGLENSIQD